MRKSIISGCKPKGRDEIKNKAVKNFDSVTRVLERKIEELLELEKENEKGKRQENKRLQEAQGLELTMR